MQSLLHDTRDDLYRLSPKVGPLLTAKTFVTSSSFCAIVLYRLSHRIGVRSLSMARLVARANLALTGADIDPRAQIGGGALLSHPVGVVIGGGVVVGPFCTLMGGVTLGRADIHTKRTDDGYPSLGAGVTIGANSVALGNLRIGRHSTIGAMSLVIRDVPEFSIAYGSPSRARPLAESKYEGDISTED